MWVCTWRRWQVQAVIRQICHQCHWLNPSRKMFKKISIPQISLAKILQRTAMNPDFLTFWFYLIFFNNLQPPHPMLPCCWEESVIACDFDFLFVFFSFCLFSYCIFLSFFIFSRLVFVFSLLFCIFILLFFLFCIFSRFVFSSHFFVLFPLCIFVLFFVFFLVLYFFSFCIVSFLYFCIFLVLYVWSAVVTHQGCAHLVFHWLPDQ